MQLLDLDDTIVSFSAGGRDYWREAFREVALDAGVDEDDFIGALRNSALKTPLADSHHSEEPGIRSSCSVKPTQTAASSGSRIPFSRIWTAF